MRYGIGAALVIGAIALSQHQTAQAAEGGVGAYLLGSRGPMAGITPPPGVYFQDDTYFYDGKLGGGRTLPTGGLLVANVSVQTWLNLPTTIWVTPAKILGGDLAFSVTSSVGEPRVNANLGLVGYYYQQVTADIDTNAEAVPGKTIKARFRNDRPPSMAARQRESESPKMESQ
jgi:hypothetical protein